MKVKYTHRGPLTLSGLIYFAEKIQDERKSDEVLKVEAETVDDGVWSMQGRVTGPSHILQITVED